MENEDEASRKARERAEKLAERLRKAMKLVTQPNNKRCTQEYLAEISTVGQGTISRILSADQTQGSEGGTVRKLADALGVHYLWLSEGFGPMKLTDPPDALTVRQASASYATQSVVVKLDAPRARPMMMTGPHFLTPDEWLIISLARRTDDIGRQDLLDYAGRLRMILNPPTASNDPE